MATFRIHPFTISVPASSANFGPGLDCFGLALSLRLTLRCQLNEGNENSGEIKIYDSSHFLENGTPLKGEDRILYAAELTAKQHGRDLLKPNQALYIDIFNEIPVRRGLGSSAAMTVAGIVLASKVLNLFLLKEEIFKIGSKIETSSVNVALTIFGGFNVIVKGDHETDIPKHMNFDWPENRSLAVWISDWELPADFARNILPKSYPREAVIPRMKAVLNLSSKKKSPTKFGFCFSGAGPSVLGISDSSNYLFDEILESFLEKAGIHSGKTIEIEPDHKGIVTG